MSIEFRISTVEDGIQLKKWLDTKEVLRFFPMATQPEVDDAVRIWLSFIQFDAALSCTLDGELVGMAVLYLQAYRKLKHQSLFAIIMSPESRGKGLGTKFMTHLMAFAKEKHALEKIHLEVYEGNPAERLYERMGFVEYGRHSDFLEDENETITKILMEKEL